MLELWRLNYLANIGLQVHAKYIAAGIVTMNVAGFHTLQMLLLSNGNRIIHGDFLFTKREYLLLL